MGCPETLITDQGREFVNNLSRALYAITNTDHQCLPPTGMLLLAIYLVDEHELIMILVFVCTPLGLTAWFLIIQARINLVCICVLFLQTNGLTERFNQTISRCLAKLVDDSQTDWDEKIDVVLMGYRASRQASTKHSPYFLLFQQQMTIIILYSTPPDKCGAYVEEGPWFDSERQGCP